MSLFPMFLKLTGRACLVVGAGGLAESKIESLVGAGARVTVVAPEATARIAGMAEAGEVVWHRRSYISGDCAGQFLAVAATNGPAVNRAVFAEAEAAGVLVNAVDDPPFCDFYFPSVVRRGELQIAISTSGASPALAQRLRREINELLPLDTGDWLAELGNLRREVLEREPLNEKRRELLHQLAAREVCGFDGCPARAMARAHAVGNPRVVDEAAEKVGIRAEERGRHIPGAKAPADPGTVVPGLKSRPISEANISAAGEADKAAGDGDAGREP